VHLLRWEEFHFHHSYVIEHKSVIKRVLSPIKWGFESFKRPFEMVRWLVIIKPSWRQRVQGTRHLMLVIAVLVPQRKNRWHPECFTRLRRFAD
jgi:hypothetical protein